MLTERLMPMIVLGINPLVDRFVADPHGWIARVVEAQTTCDLLGRPVAAQADANKVSQRAMGHFAACPRTVLALPSQGLGTIAPVGSGMQIAVAGQFATDGPGGSAQAPPNLSRAKPGQMEVVDQVTIVFAKMGIG